MRYKLLKRGKVDEWMSPKRRFISGMLGGRVDRPPVGSATSVATIEQMERTGAFFPEAHYDKEKMFELASCAYEVLGYDVIMPYFSVWIACAALGMVVDWGDKEKMPEGNHPWKKPEDIKIPEDYLDRPPITALCDTIETLAEEFGHEVAIMGKAMGPWTLSYHAAGVENTLIMSRREPDKLREMLDILKRVTLEFSEAQIEAGADVMCIPDHLTGDLASPKDYKEFLLPLHQEITKKIGVPTVLHICGDTLDRLGYIAESGFDAFHIDSKVDAFEAKRVIGDKVSLMGNINNPETLLYAEPKYVQMEALYAARAGFNILGPECAIPTTVRDENLKAITEVAKRLEPEYG
ncbi:MAG: MtaA/CmuA family methyltransferase [Candidatus Geothermarchaeales archaeon]